MKIYQTKYLAEGELKKYTEWYFRHGMPRNYRFYRIEIILFHLADFFSRSGISIYIISVKYTAITPRVRKTAYSKTER